MKRCFVISPIGAEGSEIREHSNDVYDYIIKKAMEECGIEAYRSDHLREPGKISDQMYWEIYTDDLSIAVLTGRNPNVFYELALAHAARKPVIALLQKGEALPFDISDLRCVYYDLKPRSLFEGVHVKEIVAHVRALDITGWISQSPFEKFQAAEGPGHDGSSSFYADSRQFGPQWMQMLNDTQDTFEIMGIHLGPWRGWTGYHDTLLKKSESGCKVRVLLMHEENPMLAETINEKIPEVSVKMIEREIEENLEFYLELAKHNSNIEVRQIRRGVLHCQTARTDASVAFVPYLFSRRRRDCPLWHGNAESVFYGLVKEEFASLWQKNETKPVARSVANHKAPKGRK